MTFKELGIKEPILSTLTKEGYITPTDIQAKAIPHILKKKDLLGCAQTGTGKTAAFALPIVQSFMENKNKGQRKVKVLILSPTRELAIQIKDNFTKYSANMPLRTSVIVGGVNQGKQVAELKKGVDILVATPGRLIDLVNQKLADISQVDVFVLDEADTMLDMGFIKDINRIIEKLPKKRQTLLFSATMPATINRLASSYLNDHVTVAVTPESTTVEKINQSLYYVDKGNKTKLLTDLLKREEHKSTLVFTRTKHGANKLAKVLETKGITAEVIHGNKSQSARVKALRNFKEGSSKVMIATDIAARGIDISELSHVINYEIPNQPETYVHRIGRTGRAGLGGTAISMANIDEKSFVKDIQKTIKQDIPVIEEHDYPMEIFTLSPKEKQGQRNNRGGNNKPKGNQNNFAKGRNSGGKKKNYNKGPRKPGANSDFNKSSNNKPAKNRRKTY